MLKNIFILCVITHCFAILIQDQSFYNDVILISESDYETIANSNPYLLIFYYDRRDILSTSFFSEFLKLRQNYKSIHPKLRLGLFEMTESLGTAEKLRIHSHPHFKILIHGIENDYNMGYNRVFENAEEVYEWANFILIRKKDHNYNSYHSKHLKKIDNNSSLEIILKENITKVFWCNNNNISIVNGSLMINKLSEAFMNKEVKFFILSKNIDLCKKHIGKFIIYGRYCLHHAHIINPEKNNERQISKIIKKRLHPHIIHTNDINTLHVVHHTHKPLLFLITHHNNELLRNEFIKLGDETYFSDNLQLINVDFDSEHGRHLMEELGIHLHHLPSLVYTYSFSVRSKKFIKNIKDDNKNIYNEFKEFVEKCINKKFNVNDIHVRNHGEGKYAHQKRELAEKTVHFNSFNDSLTPGPTLVLFYYKNWNYDNELKVLEKINEHIKSDHNLEIKLKICDLYQNEIENIGYYNKDKMPVVYLYKSNEDFIEITEFIHSDDILNILWVIEDNLLTERIGHHSENAIRDQLKIISN